MGSVLIVEDDPLIAQQLAEILRDGAYDVAGPVQSTQAAWPFLDHPELLICAILDVNIGDNVVFPIAQVLTQRGVPILFATAQPATEIRARWPHHTVLQKPYTADEVLMQVRLMTTGRVAA